MSDPRQAHMHMDVLRKAKERIAQLEQRILKYENDEASACPEDVGFVEYIQVLDLRATRLERELAEARLQGEHDLADMRRFQELYITADHERDILRERDKRSRELLENAMDHMTGDGFAFDVKAEIQQHLDQNT